MKSNLEELGWIHAELLDRREGIMGRVKEGDERLERITRETKNWLEHVEKMMEDEELNKLLSISRDRDNNNNGCFCYTIPRKLKMMKVARIKIQELRMMIDRCPDQQNTVVSVPRAVEELQPIPSLFCSLDSREEPLQRVLDGLRDDQVRAVAFFGMGGTGKTLLAKEVVNRAQDVFDVIVMLEISEVPDIRYIQDQIANHIGVALDEAYTAGQRAIRLYNALKQVKCRDKKAAAGVLLVLDNVWKMLDFDMVGIPRDSTKDIYCKLLITSRDKDVCRSMGVRDENISEVGLLNITEARSLFRWLAGRGDDSTRYKEIEDMLLTKCGGLPLAIATIANMLKHENLSVWRSFADKLDAPSSSRFNSAYQETYSILETSYELMKDKDKRKFFLLACLFPPGSSIPIQDMMRYGIGLNLFQYVDKTTQAMELALHWGNELCSSSLLMQDWGLHSQPYVKIHDIVRVSAISFAVKDGQKFMVEAFPRWLSEEVYSTYTAISLRSDSDHSRLSGMTFCSLEMLLLEGDGTGMLPVNFFDGMRGLRVLVLSRMNFEIQLPESMRELHNLKTLHLENCRLGDTRLIGNLVSLLVLSLRGSLVVELPDKINQLQKLRLLDLGGCRGTLTSLPAKVIYSLPQLEGLYMYNSFERWAEVTSGSDDGKQASIDELSNLKYLNELEIHIPHTTQLPVSDDFVEKLDKFKVSVGGARFVNQGQTAAVPSRALKMEDIVDANQALKDTCLKALLKKTETLELSWIMNGLSHLVHDLADGFGVLKFLRVNDCADMEHIISPDLVNSSICFPSLECLHLSSLHKLKSICHEVRCLFPNLRDVSLSDLPALGSYALTLGPAKNLTSMQVTDCENLKFLFLDDDDTEKPEFLRLKELKLQSLPKLQTMLGNADTTSSTDALPGSQPLLNEKITLPSLENLYLKDMHIGKLFTSEISSDIRKFLYSYNFRMLKSLHIELCYELESVCPPHITAAFEHLEILQISSCAKMRQVVAKEIEQNQVHTHIIIFPKLKHLLLHKLDSLECFYGGSYNVKFPELEKLDMTFLPCMSKFVISENSPAFFDEEIEFPNLKEMRIRWVKSEFDEVGELWNSATASYQFKKLVKLELHNSRGLSLIPSTGLPFLSSLSLTISNQENVVFSTSLSPSAEKRPMWSFRQLPQLQELVLMDGKTIQFLFENHQEPALDNDNDANTAISKFCQQLKQLTFIRLPEMKPIPLGLFTTLRSLNVVRMSWKCLFPADLVAMGVGKLLPFLEDIYISSCQEMEVVIVDKSEGDGTAALPIVFPKLRSIHLENLDKARHFSSKPGAPLCFPSLDELTIDFCKNLVSFCSGPFTATKLRSVRLKTCKKMEMLLSAKADAELPSLQELYIHECPNMGSFSSGTLVAPNLSHVMVDDPSHPINEYQLLLQQHQDSRESTDIGKVEMSRSTPLDDSAKELENSTPNPSVSINTDSNGCQNGPEILSPGKLTMVLNQTEREEEVKEEQESNFRKCPFSQNSVWKALRYMIIVDDLPFGFVEKPGFKRLMSLVCPDIGLPSGINVASDCYELYVSQRTKLKKSLETSCQRVCITVDMCTTIQEITYISVAAHFIDEEWKLQKRTLNFCTISNHKDGKCVADAIDSCLRDWGLRSKLFSLTVNNANASDVALSLVKSGMQKSADDILGGKYIHMRCVAGVVNLVVWDSLKVYEEAIKRVRSAVKFVRESTRRWEQFQECVKFENIDDSEALLSSLNLDVCTRWDSVYLMLCDAAKFETAFAKYAEKEAGLKMEFPQPSDWERVRYLTSFLEGLYELSRRMSGSSRVMANAMLFDIVALHEMIDKWESRPEGGKTFEKEAQQMKARFDEFWGNMEKMNKLIFIAAILDPRVKLIGVQIALSTMYGESSALSLIEMIKDEAEALYDEYWKMYRPSTPTSNKMQYNHSSLPRSRKGGGSNLHTQIMARIKSLSNEPRGGGLILTELQRYLIEPNLMYEKDEEAEDEFDILLWWKLQSPRMPILSRLARDVLAMPMSSLATHEATYAVRGHRLDHFNTTLSPMMVEAFICTRDWLRMTDEEFKIEESLEDLEELQKELEKGAVENAPLGTDVQV